MNMLSTKPESVAPLSEEDIPQIHDPARYSDRTDGSHGKHSSRQIVTQLGSQLPFEQLISRIRPKTFRISSSAASLRSP